jgi:hypothetical protein
MVAARGWECVGVDLVEAQMIWFHGTSLEAWDAICREGVLWGRRHADGMHPQRCTYLASDAKEARCYGEIVLRVDYCPGEGCDNFSEGCWQIRVYDPIPIERAHPVRNGHAPRQQALATV